MCKNQKDLRANALKQPGWASDLKLGKLKGVRERNRAKLQLLLNCSGPRVKNLKEQGLLCKKPGGADRLDRTTQFRPQDRAT
jgi:hypothetical protein